MKYLSLDIGNRLMKIARVNKTKKNIKVLNSAILKTPPNAVNDGQLLDKAAISNEIKQYLKENKIKTKHTFISISSSKIITREVSFPKVKKKTLDQLVQTNANEYFPVNLDEYLLDYKILEEIIEENQKKYHILLIAIPKKLVEEYIELVDICGLKIKAVDYDGNSMANIIAMQNMKGNYVILDLGYDSCKVSIFNEKVLKFHRDIMFGTSSLMTVIRNHQHMEEDEIEKLLNNDIFAEGKVIDNEIEHNVKREAGQIFDSVFRFIDFYKSRNAESEIDTIYITGGGANIVGIQRYIQDYFDIRTKVLSIDGNNIRTDKKDGIYIENSSFFWICLGAAFTTLSLLPDSIVQERKRNERSRLIFESTILCFLLLSAGVLFPINQIKELKAQRNDLRIKINQAEEINILNKEFLGLKEDLQKRDIVIDKSFTGGSKLLDILNSMEKKIPEEVFYLLIQVNDKELVISGIAKDKMVIGQLLQNIKQIPDIDHAYLNNISQPNEKKDEFDDNYGDRSFSIQCMIR